MKECNKCNETKELAEFYYRRDSDSYRNTCKVCSNSNNKLYREDNKIIIAAKKQEHYHQNKDEILASNKEYCEVNKSKVAMMRKEYHSKNKEDLNTKSRFYSKKHYEANKSDYMTRSANRRATKLQATPAWANQGYIKLFYIGAKMEEERTGREVHVDHIVPLKNKKVCGLHCEDNLQWLFAEDNLSKGNRF